MKIMKKTFSFLILVILIGFSITSCQKMTTNESKIQGSWLYKAQEVWEFDNRNSIVTMYGICDIETETPCKVNGEDMYIYGFDQYNYEIVGDSLFITSPTLLQKEKIIVTNDYLTFVRDNVHDEHDIVFEKCNFEH